MFRANFRLGAFEKARNGNDLAEILEMMCAVLVASNLHFLRNNPGTPKLLESGVYYKPENRGRACKRESCEDFLDIPAILAQGHADCEDLASWLAAEKIFEGIPAVPLITYAEFPDRTEYHVSVATDTGTIDPSALLGMGAYAPEDFEVK